jgi:pilus assembly protein CpaF
MVLMAGYDLPVRAIRQQVSSALDLIVHLERLEDGSRRVTAITEVQANGGRGRRPSRISSASSIEDGKPTEDRRQPVCTGLRPASLHKFEKRGSHAPA